MSFIDYVEINPSIKLEKGKEYPFIEMSSVDFYAREPQQIDIKEYSSGVKFQRGDTVISRIEPCLQNGKSFFVKNISEGFGSTEFLVFRPKDKKVNNEFLYYFLLTDGIRKSMINSMTGATGRQRVNNDIFKSLEISLPSIKKQERIANILSTYDDLIENNQKQIKLLEEAVMRLYKEWFVNLRFPGYETVKIVDGVPEGWKRSTFKSLCELIKDSIKLGHINDDISYIGLEHIPRKSICLNKWGSSSDVNSDKYRYQKKDILFGKIRPYFHKVGFAINDGVCSTDAMVFRAKENYFGLLLTTAFSDEFVANSYATCREGAKMPRADWNEMGNYPVLIPHGKTLLVFNSITNDFFDLITNKHKQNHNLSEARDKLLPKLISGEIDIPEEYDA